jgi:cysteine synthase|tara:strand:+ start:1523 stop:2401 length:879 start_codon:yes stop_codon:yes gene_type:complete
MKLINTVGNTPLLEFPLKEGTIWGKAEFLNPGGSVKDRPVAWILELAMKSGKLKKGDTIIEATSGNMGISLAMFSANLGFKCIIVMPSNMSIERKTMLKLFGAELIEVDAGDFDGAIDLRNKLAKENGYFNFNQFHTPLNVESHWFTTGIEICKDLPSDIYPDAFVAGTGTGGTIMGAGRYVKEQYPICKLVALEPAESPIMSGGKPGLHGIQGIGDGSKFLVNLNNIDRIEIVSTSEAIEKSKLLAKEWGIFVGFSAAANYLVAERLIKEGSARNVVTILCDRGERYFSCL